MRKSRASIFTKCRKITLIFLLTVVPLQAAVTLDVATVASASPGDTVTVTLNLNRGGDDISSLGAALKAQGSALTYHNFSTGAIIPGASFSVNNISADSIRIAFVNFGDGNITQDGVLVTLRFLVNNGVADSTVVNFEFSVLSATADDFSNLTVNGNNGMMTIVTYISVNLKLFLQGPYDTSTDLMNDYLGENTLLPLSQPYSGAPWNYGGTESVASLPDSAVDWLLLELRDTADGPTVASRAVFLKANGRVVDTNGSKTVRFISVPEDTFYIIVRQRNHLGIMSATRQVLSNNSSLYDFSTAQSQAFGSNPQRLMEAGVFAMAAGDGNSDGGVDALDKNEIWRVENGGAWTYTTYGDFNIDGGIDALDVNLQWRPNNGSATQIPLQSP